MTKENKVIHQHHTSKMQVKPKFISVRSDSRMLTYEDSYQFMTMRSTDILLHQNKVLNFYLVQIF